MRAWRVASTLGATQGGATQGGATQGGATQGGATQLAVYRREDWPQHERDKHVTKDPWTILLVCDF
jgi:hypothetical protein